MNVFITGASSGLGRALAEEFAKGAHKVWGVGRRSMEKAEGEIRYSRCDVSKIDETRRIHNEMAAKNFHPDIVVLNAGIMVDDLLPDLSHTAFREIVETNLFGAINWIDIYLPLFLQNKKGTFAAVSSLSAYRELRPNRTAYPASKAALSAVFGALRMQYRSSGVKFMTFHIGGMDDSGGLLKVSYKNAASKVSRHILSGRSAVVDFPAVPAVITKLSRFLPDAIVSRIAVPRS